MAAINYIGRVLDREKQAPISGAKVSLNLPGYSVVVYSDLEGIYKFQVPFDDSNVLEGEITIEAKGYKTYSSFIRLLPDDRDIGDIRLVYPHNVSPHNVSPHNVSPHNVSPHNVHPHTQEVENQDNLLPIIAAIMVVLALIVAALTLPPPQETPPPETPDNLINLQQPLPLSVNSVYEGLTLSIFS
ncbi:carboxypeptidase-like regulatory domain-containing protein [Scytonema sp. PRP1]|uniref:carboxypeptidase-like regulatory domain-containing protein n=1 Tax=Scytonema sp. PRP1 TaxID=3120513 RepID=UPI002FD29115